MSLSSSLVSIIIPVKNRRELVAEALYTVLNQSHENWEAVVVDDGSSDGTWEALKALSLTDSRIRPVRRYGEYGGTAAARNQGVLQSRGDFLLFLDSDDLLAENTIKERLEKFSEWPQADAVVGDVSYFRFTPGENDNETGYQIRPEGSHLQLEAFLTLRSPWITSGPLWRAETVRTIGQWRSSFSKADDNEYHTYALLAGATFVYLGRPDWYWRLHHGDHLSSPKNFELEAFNSVIDAKMVALADLKLLSRRNRRLIAWSYLMLALDSCVYHPTRSSFEALAIWESSRERKLPGSPLNFAAPILIRLQSIRLCSTLPREFARLLLYADLNVSHPFSWRAIKVLQAYVRYLFVHSKNYRSAQRLKERRA